MVIIAYLAILFFFHGTSSAFKAASESQSMRPPENNGTPQEIEFVEPGSIAKTTAHRYVGDVYITTDGRKFKKDGDYVKPYEP